MKNGQDFCCVALRYRYCVVGLGAWLFMMWQRPLTGPNRLKNCQQKMPHQEKKKHRLHGHHRCTNDEAADYIDFQASIESLSGDVLANIFGFLLPQEIMYARLNKKMREAAKITPTEIVVDHRGRNCNAMRVMATALPNLQKITLGCLYNEHKYVDGEDPDEERALETASHTAHEIEFISNFTKLRELRIDDGNLFNGRYPCFFNFPHLQILTIGDFFIHIKFDLDMFAGLPSLKVLICGCNDYMTGNLNSLRVLKDTLEKVSIEGCEKVEGNFMDLADFPHLKELNLYDTAVTGDIWDIGDNDFPSLKELDLPHGVYGGAAHEFQRISDAQDVIWIPYLFQKQRPEIVLNWYAKLSTDSPDMYETNESLNESAIETFAPIFISLVRAGTRYGYQWEADYQTHSCEVNWLDPEPDRESSDYGKYMEELQKIEGKVDHFKGFHQPPPQEDFESIMERILKEIDDEFEKGY